MGPAIVAGMYICMSNKKDGAKTGIFIRYVWYIQWVPLHMWILGRSLITMWTKAQSAEAATTGRAAPQIASTADMTALQ